MFFRISPLWWPVIILFSPVLIPLLLIRYLKYRKNCKTVEALNSSRIENAEIVDLPELEYLELTVLVEWYSRKGFYGDAGVSYLVKTNLGSFLFDVGWGPARPALLHNAKKLDFDLNSVDSLVISHLHCDHMGGIDAQRLGRVTVPDELAPSVPIPCYLPEDAEAEGFIETISDTPGILSAGVATTGSLSRSLFFGGLTDEQALVARIRGKGLVVVTACGHPTIETILKMAGKISDEKVYAVCGGLHFPVTDGRGNRLGIKIQTILGTGKPVWKRISIKDLDNSIDEINKTGPEKVFLSAHDICDYSISRMKDKLSADTNVLEAGSTYRL